MAKYNIEIGSSAEKVLNQLPKTVIVRILDHIEALATNPYPSGCRKLAGEHDVYRIRIGQYRVLYEVIQNKILIRVLKIGHRKDIYR